MTTVITDGQALQAFVSDAMQAESLALDTEFMREKTYYPELCLIQAACAEHLVLIDVQQCDSLAPLQALLSGGMPKILHACRQDQEVLATCFDERLQPIFDTQVAAALCGHPPQWSYASLVEHYCGVSLAKGATRTDWSKRPLSQAQLDYAADDVRYLDQARASLLARLHELGRETWFAEEMELLEQPNWELEPDEAWRKVKGMGPLSAKERGSLQVLAAWREREAVRRNRPRRWIVADPVLLELARRMPNSTSALEQVPGMEAGLLRRQGQALLEQLELARTASELPLDDRIADTATVKRLQAELRKLAGRLELDPAVLATRADLSALVLDGRSERLANGWRAEEVVPALLALL